MIFMLRLFRKLIRPKAKIIIPKPIIERKITVAKNSNVSVSPISTKNLAHKGGRLDAVKKDLISKINSLYKKQKKFGLSKKEKTLLAEYTHRLEMVASTKDGTKEIFVED